MQRSKHFSRVGKVLGFFAVTLLVTNTWAASHQVLWSFNGTNGSNPVAGMIVDTSGNFYGTTDTGGAYGFGSVYELSPNGSGGWTQTILHSFQNNSVDGIHPFSTLTFDTSGNLYGTTYQGGTHNYGTVFELSPSSGGWSETILHNFDIVDIEGDGGLPEAGVIIDSTGALIGTVYAGSTHGYGAVYKLTPNGNGTWTETHLYTFGAGTDARNPNSNLIADAQGNLYGTSYSGGVDNAGTVYELSPNGSGGWTERLLHTFTAGNDGAYPIQAGLIFDSQGNLYGTTSMGGLHSDGTVFKMAPNGSGGFTTSVIHSFGSGTDGVNPYSGLCMDGQGNLYGTTFNGGSLNLGAVFEMSPNGSGGWTETVLHSLFGGNDAANAYGPLILDSQGNLYGTSYKGGTHSLGTIFEITP